MASGGPSRLGEGCHASGHIFPPLHPVALHGRDVQMGEEVSGSLGMFDNA